MTGFKNQDIHKDATGHLWLVSWVHSVPSTRNLLLMTAASRRSSKDGGQAWADAPVMPKACLMMSLMPKGAVFGDGEHHVDWPGWGQGALQRKGKRDTEDGLVVLVTLGCFTQSRLVSDMHTHNLYISRTMISNTETNTSNVQDFFSMFRTFCIIKQKTNKQTKKQQLTGCDILAET